ncbi:MAG: hypothetical protein IJ651_01380 [Bacteroidales bacterium]|nr:hypothetical protein [Bacteroidales bacterium]
MKRMMYCLLMAAVAAMTVAGCTKYVPYIRPGGNNTDENSGRPGGGQNQGVTITECTNWSIRYEGRTDYKEEDGSISRVEEFTFDYPGQAYFIVRSITDEDFKSWYDGDIKAFLEGEVSDLVTTAQNNNQKFYENTGSVFTKNTRTVWFDMLIHGTYTTYMIEISADGKMTGNYARLRHTVEEETPVEDYLKWIGTWYIGNGKAGYEIQVSRCEANYLYYIDGWETGEAVQEQMNMDRDWLFARYRNGDGNLYFYGQYLMSYYEESLKTDVDQMFVGTYLTPTDELVDVEGADANYDIAHTETGENGTVSVVPESFSFTNGFQATYNTMRYSRYCYDEENWAHYNNSGVPSLPLKMEKLSDTKSVAGPVRRISSKAAVRRVQLRVHQPKKERSIKTD